MTDKEIAFRSASLAGEVHEVEALKAIEIINKKILDSRRAGEESGMPTP